MTKMNNVMYTYLIFDKLSMVIMNYDLFTIRYGEFQVMWKLTKLLIKCLTTLKFSMFSETLYLLIEHSYKYHTITSQQDDPQWKFLSSAILFCYHCVQFALKAVIFLLIASDFLWGCKAYLVKWMINIKKINMIFQIQTWKRNYSCPIFLITYIF